MLIYVSHPFSNKPKNKDKVEEIVRTLTLLHPENIYISPIHTFGFLYEDVSYETGLEMCFKLLDKCDKILLCDGWKNSRGCTAEALYAEFNHIEREELSK